MAKAKITHTVNVLCDNQRFQISSIQNGTDFVVWDTFSGKRFWIECDNNGTQLTMLNWSQTEWMEWLDSQKAYE